MKKKAAAAIIALCLITALTPSVSRAAVSPHFIAVNDTLLPFGDDTMPIISGGIIFVPHDIFSLAGVQASTSRDTGHVRLYAGTRRVDFYADWGVTEDQHENTLSWPPAQIFAGKIYVPLHQVCGFFDLSYTLIEAGRDVIPGTQIWVIRIISSVALTGSEFIALHRNNMIAAYNEYYGLPMDIEVTEEPAPDYSDVTIYLGFYDISAGGADEILDLLGAQPDGLHYACFFVSAGDIARNAGLIRRIYGNGHAVGVWLDEGTLEEYLETSALLFEATKIKTVLVSAEAPVGEDISDAGAYRLIFWGIQQDSEVGGMPGGTSEAPESSAIDSLPTEGGARMNLMLPCSDDTTSMLPLLLSHLRTYGYTVAGIVESILPVQ